MNSMPATSSLTLIRNSDDEVMRGKVVHYLRGAFPACQAYLTASCVLDTEDNLEGELNYDC
jgi:hypothetical protein